MKSFKKSASLVTILALIFSILPFNAISLGFSSVDVVQAADRDADIVNGVKESLVIGYGGDDIVSSVTQNMTLVTTTVDSVLITWSSSLPEVVASDGTVTRPVDTDKEVTLTATISKNSVSETKDFIVTVLKMSLSIPAAPNVTADDVNDIITDINETMEYSTDAGSNWISYDLAQALTFDGNQTVLVRVKETQEAAVGEVTILTFTENLPNPPSSAKHTKVGNDVFLGGKYIEVGVSKSGSFGTESNAPNGFHPVSRLNLGFVFDEDGFDIGNAMTSGDYFLPGSPYEGFKVGYKNGEIPNLFLNAERNPSIGIPSTSIEDLSVGDMLAVKTSGATSDDKLKVEQTVSFKENDKFFKMTVTLTNNTDQTLNDVRYMRSVDPDMDADMSSEYATINSVPFNYPNDSKSVVLAKGPVTGNALVLMSTDSRSRASLITSDPYSLVAFNDNGTIAESTNDTWMGLTFAIGNLAPGQVETIEYFYSLDSNIDQTLEDMEESSPPAPIIPPAPSAPNVTADDVTNKILGADDTMEYSIDNGITWINYDLHNEPRFSGAVNVLIRVKAIGETNSGESKILNFTKNPSPPAPPSTPAQPKVEEINVDVESGTSITKTPIKRITELNGTVKDLVTFTVDKVKETIEKLKEQQQDTARIVIPDKEDKVSEVSVTVPKESVNTLASGKVNLEIYTANAHIYIPQASVQSFGDDLYFRIIPIKEEAKKNEVEERAKKETQVKLIVGNKEVNVLGRPMEIETNMQNRPVTLTLPIPTNVTQEELNNLAIFIEHSDGTKEVIQGKLVAFDKGTQGVQFTVTKFSTFTIMYMEGAAKYFAQTSCGANADCLQVNKSTPVYVLENNRLKKVSDMLKGQSTAVHQAISPMLGLGGDIWLERTKAISYETPSKEMLRKNQLPANERPKQMWKGLELHPGQIGKVTILQDTVVWESIDKTTKLPRILKKGEQYRVYRYVPGMYQINDQQYIVQDSNVVLIKK